MKKLLSVGLLLSFVLSPFIAFAGKPIPFEELPGMAQDFITTNFPNEQIVLVEKDKDRDEMSLYEVKFSNGNKIEFNRYGYWVDLNFKHTSVPNSVVPNAILEVMKQDYPGKSIDKIEVDRRGFEVRVKHGPELHFDMNYVLIYVDD